MEKIIEVKDLDFYYDEDTHAVKNISFNIEKGKYTTIVGHNGSGKSTIAKLLMGLIEKKSGEIIVDNITLSQDTVYDIRKKVGIVFQNPDNQFIGSTVKDDIAFGLENHKVETDKMDDIILEYAKKVNMLDYLDSEPTKLSGGQKQRVAIAGVLAMRPDIIIFDESTSMLDPSGKAEINNVIKKLHEEYEITLISITHDMEEVAKSDFVIVMDNGKIVFEGQPKDVLKNDKELINIKLDIPFASKMVKALNNAGIKINDELDLERVVNNICQLSSKN